MFDIKIRVRPENGICCGDCRFLHRGYFPIAECSIFPDGQHRRAWVAGDVVNGFFRCQSCIDAEAAAQQAGGEAWDAK